MSERLLEVIRTQTEIAKLGLDLGHVMDLVAQRAQLLTGAGGAVVELAEGEDMVYRATSGMAAPHLGFRLRRGNSLSGLCIREGHPLYCEDSEIDPRVDLPGCRQIGLRSMIVVPLRHHDAVIGVLKVLSNTPAAFDETDLHILGLMSDLIAAAMFHASKYETSELFHQATHDALTGLPNRALFFERLHLCLAHAQRNSNRFGLLNLDMDGLKPINDRLGHRAGDAAIREIAQRIRQVTRGSDTVARLGGDEFGVILCYVDDHEGALAHAQRLAEQICQPFEFEQEIIALDASIGVAVFPEDGQEIDALLDQADQSMYATKRSKQRPSPR
ncbi:sensor domain-containing diguanylate cyclase [Montanilutibacter psychrotolerans]|uniref:GGDEF domain-containing protein n=1 Tax=Montanilutibacter psychrotolerans TaxID=1327343 RepID=A0A3M8T284_9GAMM|nr:sensor domain-containing diguanylate cyclase [Lysobacter psychrotolerans]RNF85240.1 GGDEF domain-containing protein [Lysobacter psychrotolerans]